MKSLNTFGKAITKIFEVFHWIGAVGMAIAAIAGGVLLIKWIVSKIKRSK